LEEDNRLTTLLFLCGLCQSRSQARQMVSQGAVTVGDQKAQSVDQSLLAEDFPADGLLLRRGKKNYCRIVLMQ
jgi:tyrosyl-tRNA synthetase